MLELKNIKKDYPAGSETVHALKGITLQFRKSDFVSILGPSGCGKTTLLNLIGGLDQYTEGDLVINGRSTKDFKDRDWDTYRNHSVGFVFQNYHLIPHQSVLRNVELALTLSGVGKAERRQRAKEALERVGLGDQLRKKPGEMSGGQMQRVAIARAIVNNPDIILADEPTGALDTETSVQVMDILKEIAHDRLVIMVTHNPDLAERYSTRIIKMLDGEVTSDNAPLTAEEIDAERQVEAQNTAPGKKKKTPSMSLLTAFGLSLKNLLTKKGRTILTSFAGSIGIIGIALILSLSTGINDYIKQVQEETLSSYPITIEAESTDLSSLLTGFMETRREAWSQEREEDRVYSSTVMFDLMNSMVNAQVETNNLEAFMAYLESGGGGIKDLAYIDYDYDFDFDIYTTDEDGVILKCDVMSLMETAMSSMFGGNYSSYFSSSMGSMYSRMDVWEELLAGEGDVLVADQTIEQYELLYGAWPQSYDEVILFINRSNEISDLMLYSLGLIPSAEMEETMQAMMNGEEVGTDTRSWSYEELAGITFKLLLPTEYFQYDPITGGYTDMSATDAGMDYLYNSENVGLSLKVVGVARPLSGNSTGAIGYTAALTKYAIETSTAAEVLQKQLDDPDTDVFNALPFPTEEDVEPTAEEKAGAITEYLSGLSVAEKAAVYMDIMGQPGQDYIDGVVAQQMADMTRQSIEEMIVEQYASEMGVDADTIRSYIADMSDEELFARVEEAIAAGVAQQYAAAVAQQLSALPADQLAGMLDMALAGEDAGISTLSAAGGDFSTILPDDTAPGGDMPAIPGGMAPSGDMSAIPGGMGGMDLTGQAGAMPGAALTGPAPFEEWQFVYLYDNYMPPTISDSTYEDNLVRLGYARLDSPSAISIYATTFAEKDKIADLIAEYNAGVDEEDQISYTDYVALLMSSITDIISGITYVLIAFVAISLIVSSIMIGVITLISVQERTKEIGILRAIGASKRNVSSMFNAETVIIGFTSGLLGVLVTYLLCIPINVILHILTNIEDLYVYLPLPAAIILIAISVALTLFSGIIPSRSAAKKDPVVALRTE